MVKFYESYFNYDYAFPTVTLAYFLRYPNPYSKHVISTDVIDRYVDPDTRRLHTVRLHLKRSKVPPAILKLLPRSIIGSLKGKAGQTFILEKSVVDLHEGWMETESKNLEWTGVLSVIEKQKYSRPSLIDRTQSEGFSNLDSLPSTVEQEGRTDVRTTVTLLSRLGQSRMLKSKDLRPNPTLSKESQDTDEEDEPLARRGLFSTWSMNSIQRSIELIGVTRTRDHVFKSTEGMKLVLRRLGSGGLVGVLEGMRQDAAASGGGDRPWQRA